MPSLVLIGPAVQPAIGNTGRETDRHNAFYYVDHYISESNTHKTNTLVK